MHVHNSPGAVKTCTKIFLCNLRNLRIVHGQLNGLPKDSADRDIRLMDAAFVLCMLAILWSAQAMLAPLW